MSQLLRERMPCYCRHCDPALYIPTAPCAPCTPSPPSTPNTTVGQTRLCLLNTRIMFFTRVGRINETEDRDELITKMFHRHASPPSISVLPALNVKRQHDLLKSVFVIFHLSLLKF